MAERSIHTGSPEPLIEFFIEEVQAEIADRFDKMMKARSIRDESVEADRRYVGTMLGLQVWSHKLYRSIRANAHEEDHG